MNKILPIIPKLVKLALFLIGALMLDVLAYAFFTPCPACTSFTQFIGTPLSLSGPLIASLASLVKIKVDNKGEKNVQ